MERGATISDEHRRYDLLWKKKKETSVPKEDNDTLRSAELLLAQVRALRLAEENAKRSSRSRTADDFEPISLLRPLEPDLSRVLAFFLNPQEAHEQGTLFLSAFCRSLQSCPSCAKSGEFPKGTLPPILGERTHATVEYAVNKGKDRFDILLQEGDTLLVIENKPRAREGNEQLKRYAEWLQRTAPSRWWLVFLCDYAPCTLPEDDALRSRILRLSFETLVDALAEAAVHVEAARVRAFVELFADYLKRQIAGISPMKDAQLLELLKEPNNIASAFRIAEAYSALRPLAWEHFTEYLRKEAGNRYRDGEVSFHATAPDDFGKEWLCIWFTPKNADNWCLSFGNDGKNDMRRFYWGIEVEDSGLFTFEQKPKLSRALRKMCFDRFGSDDSKGDESLQAWWRWGFDGKEYVERDDFPKKLESAEFLPMMFASDETPLYRMIFTKVDAVLEVLREDRNLREIVLLVKE